MPRAEKLSYQFPNLKNRDILNCLNALGVKDFTLADLKEPTHEKLTPVYTTLLETLVGMDMQKLRQPDFNASTEAWPHPELHTESLFEIKRMKMLLKLLKIAGIPNVSMRSLYYPTMKQTKLIFSGIINFAKFREDRMVTYQEFSAQTQQLLELKEQLQEQGDKLLPALKELQARREAEMPRIAKLENETQEAAQQIGHLNQEWMQLTKDNKHTKQKIGEVNETIAQRKALVNMNQQKVDTLRGQVVRSPEKLQAALAGMERQAEDLAGENNDTRDQLHTVNSKKVALTRLLEAIEERTTEAQGSLADEERQRALEKDTQGLASKVAEDEEAARENGRVLEHLNHQISLGQERLLTLAEQFEHKRAAASVALSEVNANLATLERDSAKDRAKQAANEHFVKQKQAAMAQMQDTHDEQMELLRNKYEDFGEQVREYHEVLIEGFKQHHI